MSLGNIQSELHCRILRLRRIETKINTSKFERIYAESTRAERVHINLLIRQGDLEGVSQWIKHHRALDIGERPMEWLVKRARELHIQNYSRLLKHELIREINKREKSDD